LELATEFESWDVSYIGPLSFEEVNMAVPEAGGNGEPETIKDMSSFGKLHLRPAAYGRDLFALDENNAVAYGIFRGTNVNRGAHQSGVVAWGVWWRAQEKLISWKVAEWDILAAAG
jgi:hypothetical protein